MSFLDKFRTKASPAVINPQKSQTASEKIIAQITTHQNPTAAANSKKFHSQNDAECKDTFLGVTKSICKQVASTHCNNITFNEISQLLKRNEHEIKLTALLILVEKSQISQQHAKQAYDFYFNHLQTLTSWDLIDETAPIIVGNYMQTRPQFPRDDLYNLAKSRSDWDKRIALIATQTFIDNNDFTDALNICKLCFNELSPMVQKTAGKILKDIGKKNKQVLFEFIATHQTKMPKDMLNAAMGNLSAGLKKTIRKETKIYSKK